MNKYKVTGAYKSNGEPAEIYISAKTKEDAIGKANAKGILVSEASPTPSDPVFYLSKLSICLILVNVMVILLFMSIANNTKEKYETTSRNPEYADVELTYKEKQILLWLSKINEGATINLIRSNLDDNIRWNIIGEEAINEILRGKYYLNAELKDRFYSDLISLIAEKGNIKEIDISVYNSWTFDSVFKLKELHQQGIGIKNKQDVLTQIMCNNSSDVKMVDAILSMGIDINSQEKYSGNTLLHKIAESGYLGSQHLIDKGIDPDMKNNKGQTALDVAKVKLNREFIENFERISRR